MVVARISPRVIFDSLKAGRPVAVAYDQDPNTHLPCLKGGSAAHWALIRGFASRDSTMDEDLGSRRNFLLLLSHSLSPRPLVCSFESLAASNAQLASVKTNEKGVGRWAIPGGGMKLSGYCAVSSGCC